MTAEETLYTYHPIKHDLELRTDLWPTSTIVDAMEEYAAQAAEQARKEERERHSGMVDYLKMRAIAGGRVARATLIAAGYEIKEEQ